VTRLLLVMVAALGWSGAGPSRWSESAFGWWRRSVRRSLTVAAVVAVCVVALPLLTR
jgi:hypothetical protein